MDKPKILSGDELVARGITKVDGSLPEVGLKDVVPTGSWLEQKQVQSALEARRHLIEIERIEKSGSLSQAVWCEELMMAEVTQKVGGHWQYLGHNVGKHLYLQPEEALFLMELNALQLKYNEVTVSLQHAYALLLRSKVSLLQYKVYASLSRVGYKVFRHEQKNQASKTENSRIDVETLARVETEKNGIHIETLANDESEINGIDIVELARNENENSNLDSQQKDTEVYKISEGTGQSNLNNGREGEEKTVEVEKKVDMEKIAETAEDCSMDTSHDVDSNKPGSKDENISPEVNTIHETSNVVEAATEVTVSNSSEEIENKSSNERMQIEECDTIVEPIDTESREIAQSNERDNLMEVDPVIVDSISETGENYALDIENNVQSIPIAQYQNKLRKFESRQLKPCNTEEIEKSFQAIPDMCHNQIVTVKIPSEEHIPKNVFLNKTSYVLNVESIRSKKIEADTSTSENDNSYSENNTPYRRRINQARNFQRPNFPNWQQSMFNTRPFGTQFRPFQFPFMRPQANMNILQWNFLMNLQRIRTFPRPPPLLRFPNIANSDNASSTNDNETSRKRARVSSRKHHMNSITMLASRLRQLVRAGNTQRENIIALQRLIATYNVRYRANLKLNANFEIVNNETILETIDLDDDAPNNIEKDVGYDENFKKIKELAQKLKDLEAVKKATSKHRRVLSSVIKKFNKSYNADICLKNNEVVDKSLITLDSSDSDCVVEEPPKKLPKSGKKLKNPFSILKRLSEKNSYSSATTVLPNGNQNDDHTDAETQKYSDEMVTLLGHWLPKENDFGRAEIPTQNVIYECIVDQKRGEYLYEFIKNHPNDFKNWLELKIGLLKAVEAAQIQIESTKVHPIAMDESKVDPIIAPEDCTDTPSILEKLSVIKKCTDVKSETHLKIDFDVYNRDVQNFKKTNKPTPHFRVICMSESSPFPSGSDAATLHSSYKGEVPILFAAVGIGSVSYLQVNPSDLPVYLPNSDFS